MVFTAFMESVTAAASVGMGCGTCCGSGISTALYGYLTTHMKNMKQSLIGFVDFFLGKFIAVISLCCIASVAGSNIIDENGCIFGIKTALIADTAMLIMGIWLLIGWIREFHGHKSCKSCNGCKSDKSKSQEYKKSNHAALIGMGISYGASPCAPLILMTGYAASLPLGYAALLGAVFAAASTISPMLFMLFISGILAGKMYQEIPQYLKWFRLACYIMLIILFTVSLLKEVSIL